MLKRLILTHNLGTLGNTAVIYNEQGQIVKSWLSLYPTSYTNGNMVEQNPQHWWKAVCESTRNVLRGINEKSIAVVSFSGQMMGCLCLDKAGDPIRNSIIWADMRAYRESQALHNLIDEAQFYRITGHRISSAYTLSKLLWVKNNQPEVYKKTDKVVQSKDYIVFRLTNRLVTDFTDATGTNMFDLNKREWSKTILSITGIDREMLPEVIESTEIAGTVTIEAAAETGLLPGTPVVIGAGDGLCATIAGACTEPEDAYLYFGSSSWIGLTRKDPYWDPEMRTFNWAHVIPDMVCPCGTMQAGGASLDWTRDQIARSEIEQAKIQGCSTQDLIDYEILQSPPGANGLLFLPYLLGERSPYWNPAAKGAMLGLKKKHTREDLFRSYVEGVGLNLKIIWNALKPVISASKLVLLGGQAKSMVNRQIIADVLGIPVVTHEHLQDSKNFGAAMIGGKGIELYQKLTEVKDMVHIDKQIEPNLENTAYYDQLLPVFENGYKALEDVCTQLDSINEHTRG